MHLFFFSFDVQRARVVSGQCVVSESPTYHDAAILGSKYITSRPSASGLGFSRRALHRTNLPPHQYLKLYINVHWTFDTFQSTKTLCIYYMPDLTESPCNASTLFRLSPELRLEIWRLALILMRTWCVSRRVLIGMLLYRVCFVICADDRRSLPLIILRLCKAFSFEAMDTFYSSNTFTLSMPCQNIVATLLA